jgi:hypothetical protein
VGCDIVDGMETNPYKSPSEFSVPAAAAKDRRWQPATWGFIGFALGTVVAAQFVLSINRVDRAMGGAIFGGLPAGLDTFMSVVERRRKEREEGSRPDDWTVIDFEPVDE